MRKKTTSALISSDISTGGIFPCFIPFTLIRVCSHFLYAAKPVFPWQGVNVCAILGSNPPLEKELFFLTERNVTLPVH